MSAIATSLYNEVERYTIEITATSPRTNEFTPEVCDQFKICLMFEIE